MRSRGIRNLTHNVGSVLDPVNAPKGGISGATDCPADLVVSSQPIQRPSLSFHISSIGNSKPPHSLQGNRITDRFAVEHRKPSQIRPLENAVYRIALHPSSLRRKSTCASLLGIRPPRISSFFTGPWQAAFSNGPLCRGSSRLPCADGRRKVGTSRFHDHFPTTGVGSVESRNSGGLSG